MSSTWSNLGINLQGTGDNSGTWGQLTNVNLQDFDYAIAGVAAITLTGNTTLAFTTNSSSTTYTSEAGRAKILVLSGSLSATTVTVTVPNIQKDYAVINNSGATVIISAGGSTTVSIPTSTQAAVYVNGSSSVAFELVNFGNITALLVTATSLAFTTATGSTATVTNLTTTSLAFTTATGSTATVTTANITTANVTTANITSLVAVTATATTLNSTSINITGNGVLKIYNTANSQYTGLQVAAGATTSQTFTLPSADGSSGQVLTSNGSGVLGFNGTLYANATSVGVGTTSPTQLLQVALNGATALFSGTTGNGSAISLAGNGNVLGSTDFLLYQGSDSVSSVYVLQRANGPMIFGTNNAERMRIDSSGRLLVGTTNTSGTAGSGVKIGLSTATEGDVSVVGAATNNANDTYHLYSTGAGAYRFYVEYGGQIRATVTSIAAISDASLKENIRDLETGLAEIMALKPRRFDWIEETKLGTKDIAGFIAQEVETILPDLVSESKYSLEETKKSIRMGDMIPTLVKAIQEQQTIINDLKARITALEGAKIG